ncbi:MAG: putative DNA binding domain-containing protein, partial [Alphaproteobacteria bacterium]|nr:putative DNA binding domain-containing protein [Alphaproteobacteria bacterium]
MSSSNLVNLLSQLRALPRETEWVEFKHNNSDPDEIGEYISALANAAAISYKRFAYLVWGVRDEDHEVVGTKFDPHSQKKGGEQLESWLSHMLEPDVAFRVFVFSVEDDRKVVILRIARATHRPVRFNGEESIRVGSYKKKLKSFPERERLLWRVFDEIPFESGIVAEHISEEGVVRVLHYTSYFDLLDLPLPRSRSGILEALENDRLIRRDDYGQWDISNMGAILFSKRLDRFDFMRRKATRVIQYAGSNRIDVIREQEGVRGYACGFEGLVQYIDSLLPVNEVITRALRKTVSMFPTLAVRELVGNALIHQDFFATGSGPMVEIFDDRIEITSPGEPLLDTRR